MISKSFKVNSQNAKRFLIASFLTSLGTGAFTVLFGITVVQSGHSEQFLGSILAMGLLGTGVISLPAGFMADLWGRKKVLLIALALTGFGLAGKAFFSISSLTLGFSFLFGMGQGMFATVTMPILAEYSRGGEQAYLFSLNFSLTMGAQVIGSFLAGKLPGWMTAYWSLVLFSLLPIAALILSFFMTEGHEKGMRKVIQPKTFFKDLQKSEIARKVLVYNFLIGLGAGLVIPFFNIFLSQKLHASLTMVGTVMSISQIGMALAGFLAPYIMLSLGKVRSVVIFQLLSVPLLIMIAVPQSVEVVILSFLLRNILMNMNNPITGSFIMEITPPPLRATVSSLIGMAQNLSRAISVSIGGWLMGTMGYSAPYFVTAFLYLIASGFYWYAFAAQEQELIKKKSNRNLSP